MTMPYTAKPLAQNAFSTPVASDRGTRPTPVLAGGTRTDGRPQRSMPLMRKIEVACLGPTGDIVEFTRIVPAIPAFDEAFSAFARGTLFPTDRGLVAVEDLLPGDRLKTASNGFQTLLWRGSTLVVPQARGQDPAMGRLTRIAADALGIARPMHDLVLGPHARIAHRAPGVARATGSDAALIPAADFIDGDQVIEITPPSPVPVFHLAFTAHERLLANGVEVESFHPGPAPMLTMRPEYLSLFLSCFPHVGQLAEFDVLCLPRLRLGDLDLVNVA